MPKFHEVVNATKRNLLEKASAHAGGDYKKAAELLGFENPKYIYPLLDSLKLSHLLK